MSDPISEYGFTAVHASAKQLLLSSNNNNNNNSSGLGPSPLSPVSIPVPDTALSKRIQSYAKKHLPEATYNHSMRVYYYGQAIRRYRFAEWSFADETYFLSCLLHDIGTTEENLHATRLSFEFYGGYLALDVLQNGDANAIAPREQAESVAEAIIRHQDLCEVGKITAVGQLVQLATIFGADIRDMYLPA
ncbi:hypothetical protein UA08_04526 [Talaromyces atroroseus]|uniref:HD domain-containing protein n=1 Tax=Talaromyces atroroseus TaxID=1441469 RepID=A0A225AN61_TALAT|nr:hypothetical protein UA08_04526 [Talaromyces atroroseus]OKL59794.1 hypothetical protein UA08_04526 [Talaromyces atroroseus]